MAPMDNIIGSMSESTSMEEAIFDPKWKEMMLSKYDNIMKNDLW